MTVSAASLPSGAGHGVAAGAWWAVHQAIQPLGGADPAFTDWVASRATALGVAATDVRTLLQAPFHAEAEAPVAGTALPVGAPLLQVTAPLPALVARASLLQHTIALGFVAATVAQALCDAADGRPLVDDVTAHHPAPSTSPFLAWCGRVGGMSGTTHHRAGWAWELPVVGVPSIEAPPIESTDAVLDANDLHASVAGLARRTMEWSQRPTRLSLDKPLIDEHDIERHFQLRRALDRHGFRRTRICAEVNPSVDAIKQVVQQDVPVDILIIRKPWWTVGASVQARVLEPSLEGPPTAGSPVGGVPRVQLVRTGDQVSVQPWPSQGLLQPIAASGSNATALPPVLPRDHPLRTAPSPSIS